jgi:hypothetical protein
LPPSGAEAHSARRRRPHNAVGSLWPRASRSRCRGLACHSAPGVPPLADDAVSSRG